MVVTSVISNAVHPTFPLKFNHKSLNYPASSSSHPQFLLLRSVTYRRPPDIALVYAKKTQDDDDAVSATSEGDGNNTLSFDKDSGGSQSHLTSSADNSVNETPHPQGNVSSVRTVALCVFAAVAFGVGLGFKDGVGKASEFFAGYLLEQSLSVDNLFVFVLIFKYFKVPLMYQNRVLSYGIAGAVVFRLTLILLGTATLQLFRSEEDNEDLSENFIVKTCQKFIPVTANYDGNRFFTVEDGVRKATPLLLTVAVIELSDIAFAVDSIPAVFGVTRDPFIVFSSNLFAILGLRSLYTLISESMGELEYLQPSIAIVLGFIGLKMVLDFFGYHVGTEVSLGFVATSLTTGVLLSLIKKSD
ncbi:thylakoid membrane protein TERC, chloroplastic isoform X2 [Silene latifolia]|uniref:thylakoid membrane protein TERC, chloroplastic isoform X2 n=1 Tax=Silene latifolia TaxID=37657 RepID=UPI003D7818FB